MCTPSKDQALHQCRCFDHGMTCFGAVRNMPCPTIHHDLLEYLLSQMIFKVSTNNKEIREMGASATPNPMSEASHTGTNPPSMQPKRRPQGRPKKKRPMWKRSCAPSLSPPHVQLSEEDDINTDSESNTGARDLWDPHAGLKPSERDDLASDGSIKVEDDLPPEGDEEVLAAMVNMMVDLEEHEDGEWLPPRLRKRVKARKKGIISSA